jgi:hypothetical protein
LKSTMDSCSRDNMNYAEWVWALTVGCGCIFDTHRQRREVAGQWRRRIIGLDSIIRDLSVTRGRSVCLRCNGGRTRLNRHRRGNRSESCSRKDTQPVEEGATVGSLGERCLSGGLNSRDGGPIVVLVFKVVFEEDGEFLWRGLATAG